MRKFERINCMPRVDTVPCNTHTTRTRPSAPSPHRSIPLSSATASIDLTCRRHPRSWVRVHPPHRRRRASAPSSRAPRSSTWGECVPACVSGCVRVCAVGSTRGAFCGCAVAASGCRNAGRHACCTGWYRSKHCFGLFCASGGTASLVVVAAGALCDTDHVPFFVPFADARCPRPRA